MYAVYSKARSSEVKIHKLVEYVRLWTVFHCISKCFTSEGLFRERHSEAQWNVTLPQSVPSETSAREAMLDLAA